MKKFLTKNLLFVAITTLALVSQLAFARRKSRIAPQISKNIYVAPDFYQGYFDHGHYQGYLCPGCKVVHPKGYKCKKAKRTTYCRIHSKRHSIWSRCPY